MFILTIPYSKLNYDIVIYLKPTMGDTETDCSNTNRDDLVGEVLETLHQATTLSTSCIVNLTERVDRLEGENEKLIEKIEAMENLLYTLL